MVIRQDVWPGLKRFLKPVGLKERRSALVIRCIVAFVMHRGRMAAARAAKNGGVGNERTAYVWPCGKPLRMPTLNKLPSACKRPTVCAASDDS